MKPRMSVCILVLIVFGISTQYGIADDFNWPRWRGPNGNGISAETNWDPAALEGNPGILWKANVGLGYSNVAIKDNRLYTMGMKGVVCLNAETGEEIWRFAERFPDPRATPAIERKLVYASTSTGKIFCLQVKNGKLRWEKNLESDYEVVRPYYSFAASPVFDGDLLIITANNSGLVLDKKTGKKVWGSEKPPSSREIEAYWRGQTTGTDYATPVLYDSGRKRYAVISSWEGIHAVEVETGSLRWLYKWELYRACQISDPLIFDNKVFIAGACFEDRKFGCVLLNIAGESPEVIWKNHNLDSQISSPVILDGYIYGVHGGPDMNSSSLRCLDVETGEVRWEEKLGEEMLSLMAADGKLIVLEDEGIIHIVEATPMSYKEISSADVLDGEKKPRNFWTPPVLCNGRIYCRNYAGDLVCIDVSK